jgi:hypothetical protein
MDELKISMESIDKDIIDKIRKAFLESYGGKMPHGKIKIIKEGIFVERPVRLSERIKDLFCGCVKLKEIK